jgi:predicted permease
MNSLLQDTRFALRQLRQSPGVAAMIVMTLALGIGASSAMFAVVDQVLLRPLPYFKSGQLVEIKESGKNGPSMFGAPFLDIEQWRRQSHNFQSIAFHAYDKPTYFIEGNTGPIQVNAPRVSDNLFATLGVNPTLGRTFEDLKGDEFSNTGESEAVVLSDAVWRDGFGENLNILGKTIRLNGESYTVIGVMPRGFQFPFDTEKPQVWVPVALGDQDKARTKNATPEYRVISRLKNGVSVDAARAELKVIQSQVAKQYTDPNAREDVTSVEMHAYDKTVVRGSVKKALIALLGASFVLWLIACVNVTNVLLVRAATRQRELAVRGALGASHWRIGRQLFIEALVLSSFASLLGMTLLLVSLKLFEVAVATQLSLHFAIVPNVSLTCFLLGLTAMTAVIASVWPALSTCRTPIDSALRQSGSLAISGRQNWLRRMLVITEFATSVVLLIGCGLLLRTIYSLKHVSVGFRTDHIIVADMVIPAYKYDGKNMTTELYDPLVARVQHLPGVQAAALTTAVPLAKRFPILFTLAPEAGDPNAEREEELTAQFRAVGPGLQKVFGFHMLRGRFFNDGDTPGSFPVVVVNRSFVRAYLGKDQDPGRILGEHLLSYAHGKPAEIVGVIDDERQSSIAEASQPEIEVCIPQITPSTGFYRVAEGMTMELALRTERDPRSFIPELREVLRHASPELASSTLTTMDQVVADSYGDQRTAARLLQIFAGSALVLCIAGLYGLLAYLVAQRTHEIGIRMALGAQRRQVISLVMREAVWTLLAASLIGLFLSYFSAQLVTSFLYGVKADDAATIAAAIVVLIAAGSLATYIPARRAAKVDPIVALRYE